MSEVNFKCCGEIKTDCSTINYKMIHSKKETVQE